jgi:hypothetical protein
MLSKMGTALRASCQHVPAAACLDQMWQAAVIAAS